MSLRSHQVATLPFQWFQTFQSFQWFEWFQSFQMFKQFQSFPPPLSSPRDAGEDEEGA